MGIETERLDDSELFVPLRHSSELAQTEALS